MLTYDFSHIYLMYQKYLNYGESEDDREGGVKGERKEEMYVSSIKDLMLMFITNRNSRLL